MTEKLRLMAVHAHPDDESSKGAATMARYVAEGVDVLVATCTGGERGSVLNSKMDRPEVWRDITGIRAKEMERAREILGVKQAWLGFVDSGLPEGWLPDSGIDLPEDCFYLEPLEVASAPLVRLIREFKPHVVITYDEDGGYPHPDHIKTHVISMEAFDAAGDPERYKEFGEPWQPSKLYYHMSFGRARLTALHEAVLAEGLESPYGEWLESRDWTDDKGERVTTKVECASYFPVRDEALKAHATQVDPEGFWFRVPMEIQQKAWPTEDYELVKSHVATTKPEDDLFAGLR
ncbi:mycothiol conjugate amidase Mca [Stackebrandtia nassauensis]|uniref:mycothiol conjugate amidase Mca n=1 Tax=Stackebrandtia nassauensis TaxID=283811 RepID=UPI00059F4B01|nr:mycothiol conjugate amidase Mca [Stackebrandtia nassauensis]